MRHEDDGERRLHSVSTKLSIALRNGSPVLVLQLLVLALFIVEGKSWSSAASTALPRLCVPPSPRLVDGWPALIGSSPAPRYTIYVVLWVFVPRPRKSSGASSHTTSTVPDLTWSSQSDPRFTNVSGRGDLPTPPDGSRPSTSSLGRLHPAQLFSRQGRRDWRSSLAEVKLRKTRGRRKAPAEPKAYVVDLRDEEDSAGRTDRRTTLLFPDDDVEGRAGAGADEVKFGNCGTVEKFDDAADWRTGLVMQESQSVSLGSLPLPSSPGPALTRTRHSLRALAVPADAPSSPRIAAVFGPALVHARARRRPPRRSPGVDVHSPPLAGLADRIRSRPAGPAVALDGRGGRRRPESDTQERARAVWPG